MPCDGARRDPTTVRRCTTARPTPHPGTAGRRRSAHCTGAPDTRPASAHPDWPTPGHRAPPPGRVRPHHRRRRAPGAHRATGARPDPTRESRSTVSRGTGRYRSPGALPPRHSGTTTASGPSIACTRASALSARSPTSELPPQKPSWRPSSGTTWSGINSIRLITSHDTAPDSGRCEIQPSSCQRARWATADADSAPSWRQSRSMRSPISVSATTSTLVQARPRSRQLRVQVVRQHLGHERRPVDQFRRWVDRRGHTQVDGNSASATCPSSLPRAKSCASDPTVPNLASTSVGSMAAKRPRCVSPAASAHRRVRRAAGHWSPNRALRPQRLQPAGVDKLSAVAPGGTTQMPPRPSASPLSRPDAAARGPSATARPTAGTTGTPPGVSPPPRTRGISPSRGPSPPGDGRPRGSGTGPLPEQRTRPGSVTSQRGAMSVECTQDCLEGPGVASRVGLHESRVTDSATGLPCDAGRPTRLRDVQPARPTRPGWRAPPPPTAYGGAAGSDGGPVSTTDSQRAEGCHGHPACSKASTVVGQRPRPRTRPRALTPARANGAVPVDELDP